MTLHERATAAGLIRIPAGVSDHAWHYKGGGTDGGIAVWRQFTHGRWDWWASLGPDRRAETSHESEDAALRAVVERLEAAAAAGVRRVYGVGAAPEK